MNGCKTTLSGKDYKPRTLPDALCAKPGKPQSHAPVVAAITEQLADTMPVTDLVAAIFLAATTFTNNESSSDTLDASISSVSAPLKEKHLIWQCSLTNMTDHIWIKTHALINSGTHLVLICPDLVTQLRLPVHKLPTPEQIAVVVDATAQCNTITHYVMIQPTSLDKQFLSQPLCAVITPGLCIPLILGLPFLTTNEIVCNYAT